MTSLLQPDLSTPCTDTVMRIGTPELRETTEGFEYRVAVQAAAGPDTLWYRVEPRYADLVSSKADAAITGLLLPAMFRGEDIICEGPISERLLFNASEPLQSVLLAVMPRLNRIRLEGVATQERGSRAPDVALGFSAGVDSFCALADHFYGDVADSYRATHLLFNNVGSHGPGGERLFRERFERTRRTVQATGLPFVSVNSNLDAFFAPHDFLTFGQTHSIRNATVPLLLQEGIGRFLYSSGQPYTKTFTGPTRKIGHSDPITLPLICTDQLDALVVGCRYTRIEKMLRVTEIEASHSALDVCVNVADGSRNCSRCWKCMRAQLTLDVLGKLELYSGAFDLAAYRARRKRYIGEVLRSDGPLLTSLRQHMIRVGYPIPFASRLYAVLDRPPLSAAIDRALMTAGEEPGP